MCCGFPEACGEILFFVLEVLKYVYYWSTYLSCQPLLWCQYCQTDEVTLGASMYRAVRWSVVQ